jgi:cytochrome c biogenesis protein CcmG, thiol:disulfide interchange protein DsbE
VNTVPTARRASRLLALAAALLMAASGSSRAGSPPADAPIPSFTLSALDGSTFSHDALAGKVTLVDFWTTWCKPCLDEIPQWNASLARYGARGLTILGITVQSGSATEIKATVEKLKIDYPILIGDERVVMGFGGLTGFPTTFLVDRDGRIRQKYTGQYPSKHAQIERDIRILLR